MICSGSARKNEHNDFMSEPSICGYDGFTGLIQVVGNSDERDQELKCWDMDFSTLKDTLKYSEIDV